MRTLDGCSEIESVAGQNTILEGKPIMENNVSHALRVLQEPVQYVCLAFMATMYAIKIYQLMKKPGPPEKAELKGNRLAGSMHSLANVLRPWGMESTRNDLYFYAEFIIFHIGVALTIGSTFLIPLAPQLMTPMVTQIIMVFMALAFLIGVRRIYRRLTKPEIRIISSPDDYFAVISDDSILCNWLFRYVALAGGQTGDRLYVDLFPYDHFLPSLRSVQQDIALRVVSIRTRHVRPNIRRPRCPK